MKNTLFVPVLILISVVSGTVFAASKDNYNVEEVLAALAAEVRDFDKKPAQSRDAALKMALFGDKAVPVLAEILAEHYKVEKGNPQILAIVVWALSCVKSKSGNAARVILPLLEDAKTPIELRSIIVQSPCVEYCDEAVAILMKLAGKADVDPELRKKLLSQLSVMPAAWVQSEKIFVDALASEDVEIRILAAKQCYYFAHPGRIYFTAIDRLIELSENDTNEIVRTQSILALSRMKIRLAVPMLMRVLSAETSVEKTRALGLRALNEITGVYLKDREKTLAWWEKSGKSEYGKLEQLKAEQEVLKEKMLSALREKTVEPKKPAPVKKVETEAPVDSIK